MDSGCVMVRPSQALVSYQLDADNQAGQRQRAALRERRRFDRGVIAGP